MTFLLEVTAWLAVLPFRMEAFSEDPRESFRAARAALAMTHLFSFACVLVSAVFTGYAFFFAVLVALSWSYQRSVINKVEEMVDRDVVRDVMES